MTSDFTWTPSTPSVTTPHTSLPAPLTHKFRSLEVAPVSNCEFDTLKIVPVEPDPALNQISSVKLPGAVYDDVDSNHPLEPSKAMPVPPIGPAWA